MRNYFIFDGKSSVDFNCFIAQSNMFDGAEHDDSSVEIPGRNGALLFSNGRWKNFKGTATCYIPQNMQTNVDGLRAFLSARHGYCRYEEAFRPGEYRMARFKGPFSLSESDRVCAVFDVTFDCKPQRFLKSGETAVTFYASGSVFNPTEFDALPLILCNGTSGTVTINGVAVTVTGCSAYAEIDCDAMEVYEGSTNRNGTTTLTDGEFPKLVPGTNTITFTGFTSVAITPRFFVI